MLRPPDHLLKKKSSCSWIYLMIPDLYYTGNIILYCYCNCESNVCLRPTAPNSTVQPLIMCYPDDKKRFTLWFGPKWLPITTVHYIRDRVPFGMRSERMVTTQVHPTIGESRAVLAGGDVQHSLVLSSALLRGPGHRSQSITPGASKDYWLSGSCYSTKPLWPLGTPQAASFRSSAEAGQGKENPNWSLEDHY